MAEHFKDIQKIQDILHEAQTGLWAIELEEGKEPRMYADKAMLELLGFAGEPSPEECYRGWYERIDPDYYPMVQNGVQRICADERAEVEYLWHHPLWGQIYALRRHPGQEFSERDLSAWVSPEYYQYGYAEAGV